MSVGTKLAERVVAVDVEEGDTVKKGQTLAHLDGRAVQARLLAARSRVKLMQARYDEMLAGFRPQEIESQRPKPPRLPPIWNTRGVITSALKN